jgi:hypothetical protein
MTIMIVYGIKIFLVSWFITRFQPLKMALAFLPDKLIWNIIRLLFSCIMCLSFWSGLGLTGDIIFASAMAFISFWYDKVIGFYEDRIKLN